jgi:hypothetical protein
MIVPFQILRRRKMAHIISILLIIFITIVYLIGVAWTLFGRTPPDWLANSVNIVGGALATNFGAVLGIELTEARGRAGSNWDRFIAFLRRIFSFISGFDLNKLPDYAAGLYFGVLVLGSIVLFFRPSDTGLAHNLFFTTIGAGIALLIYYLKKP